MTPSTSARGSGKINRIGLISVTGTTVAAPSFVGTVVTIPAGPAGDGAWLLVVGVAL